MDLPEQKLFIDGRPADATSGEVFETRNPATGAVLARIQVASDAEVDRAVASARAAFDDGRWRN
ncbi:MAG TPA: aldehyde dehydrogenase family protein, partial [Arenibaculum sp.]|nr:aldehyde dehydrogenase family protein [Arenibaculum sp.]